MNFMLLHAEGIDSFTDERARRERATALHGEGQVTAQWSEPTLDVIVQLPDRLESLEWDGHGTIRDAVRATYPAATGFQFPDSDGDWILGDWLPVSA